MTRESIADVGEPGHVDVDLAHGHEIPCDGVGLSFSLLSVSQLFLLSQQLTLPLIRVKTVRKKEEKKKI